MSTEELRQNVFSSIHLSTLMKSIQGNITYPSCTFCGGTLTSSSSRGSPKRKSAICQISLYTNSSESFIVWCKKQDEPKGMLWMRTCCVRKGDLDNAVELISRGCRGRCSYTLKFSSNSVSEEWYKLLKQESRKIPSFGDELPSSLMEETGYQASLDYVLTDITPLSVLNEVLHGNNEEAINEDKDVPDSSQSEGSPTSSPKLKSKTSKSTKSVKHKRKSSPVIINPLQGLSAKTKKTIPTNSSFTGTSLYSVNTADSIENYQDADYLSRWSWPVKV